ncbi:hypothetical protein A3F28_03340 [Candidatus Uhrbacteria bacterium RIFCSPHIGHO2_12_FULL_57_11]|uniref:ribose-phosphate diphosphokinase n=2 Tax=Candidatus Uhriibacteriota TaxID=1752732 RepID=A0A1F7UKQ3_9BACT|nr:MAG: hypothetical protein A3D72_01515 [Candidatus Uhrbacteria bacterium RIFCSPHIGHO2_02_FULL_57_19]OGL78861.1 MAG: hypothetical protein A3F28_03340 [Candidatus Uhrbacteria bacterium RIFCSPHIGHO2_12_FULL_57_11]
MRNMIFSTPISTQLAKKIASAAGTTSGHAEFRSFADGERYVRVLSNVRGRSVVALGSTPPPAENWIDLLFLIRALKENGARRVTAVLPYLGYGRGDHVEKKGEMIALRLVANLLESAGASRVIVVDPHAAEISRFFRVPASAVSILDGLLSKIEAGADLLTVAPDRGAAERAGRAARILGTNQVVVFKKIRPRPNVVRLLPGKVIRGTKSAIIVDDMIDTGGTVVAAIRRLRASGVRNITVAATHGILSRDAAKKIRLAGAASVIVSDTLPVTESQKRLLKIVGTAEAIVRVL